MFDSANCTHPPAQAASDAGVAGAGVLLSFIVTAGIALVLSAWIIFSELLRSTEAKIARKLLLSFSDQQIITGIGLQSVGLAKMETMIPYHFFLIWMLSSISTATHSAALLALFHDFKRDWVLRWLREFLMFVNLALSCVSGVFVLKDITAQIFPTLPIACVWQESTKQERSSGDMTASLAGTIAVIVGQVLVYTMAIWYLHSRSQRWLQITRALSFVVLMAIGIGATVRIITLSQAFGKPSVALADNGEKDWSFGQLLGLLLLLLPLMSAVEIYRGEMKVPSPLPDDKTPLILGSDHPFDPNPFWGGLSREK
ncbi:hypothetical protein BJ878DRAFT_427289 [Calycina marina]|uniref:Uncharacterized protein n=1 Tax=Calycina marina TaxID=1763456 RepID=A0A9P8CCM2_9HELO|nr:hypothetical protein BJ878DRAFT_427289 [Calycina marina]